MTQLKLTDDILAAALEGFAIQKDRIDAKIAEIKNLLNGSHTAPDTTTEVARPRKKRSAAVRRKMALAQRARYAKLRQVAEPTLKRRILEVYGGEACGAMVGGC